MLTLDKSKKYLTVCAHGMKIYIKFVTLSKAVNLVYPQQKSGFPFLRSVLKALSRFKNTGISVLLIVNQLISIFRLKKNLLLKPK